MGLRSFSSDNADPSHAQHMANKLKHFQELGKAAVVGTGGKAGEHLLAMTPNKIGGDGSQSPKMGQASGRRYKRGGGIGQVSTGRGLGLSRHTGQWLQ